MGIQKQPQQQQQPQQEQQDKDALMIGLGRLYIFIKGCLPSKVIFHQMSSSIKGCLPSKFVFHQRLSSIKGLLPSKDVFHWRSSSIEVRLPLMVVLNSYDKIWEQHVRKVIKGVRDLLSSVREVLHPGISERFNIKFNSTQLWNLI